MRPEDIKFVYSDRITHFQGECMLVALKSIVVIGEFVFIHGLSFGQIISFFYRLKDQMLTI